MKYIMITGHRKSGTTLLHKLFDNHPSLNVYPVDLSLLYAFYPCWSSVDNHVEEKKARFSLVLLKSISHFDGIQVSKTESSFDAQKFVDFFWSEYEIEALHKPSSIIASVAEAYCKYTNLDQSLPFVFKETSQAINFRGLIDDGLEIQCVQIIRDPRDNYAAIKAGVRAHYSKMNEDENESLASVLNRARLDLELAKIILNDPDYRFTTVRFEDLIYAPRKQMERLSKFLGVDWSDCFLCPTFLGRGFSGNNHDGTRFSGISDKNVGRWVERISPYEAAVIEGWMNQVMIDWGYKAVFENSDHLRALEQFYAWYNCRYFYRDSFGMDV